MEAISLYICKTATPGQRTAFPGRFLVFFLATFLAVSISAQVSVAAQRKKAKSKAQKLLERSSNRSLYRLKRAIKKDGYFSGRAALNVWRINALEAGIFDQEQYDVFKEQIYKKSIAENLKWFDIFVKQKNLSDARTCLRLWRLHSQEIGLFDEEKYEEMKERLKN